eukprot:scaffold332466_cov45-Prasinocladus_malaysianus.AAC.1
MQDCGGADDEGPCLGPLSRCCPFIIAALILHQLDLGLVIAALRGFVQIHHLNSAQGLKLEPSVNRWTKLTYVTGGRQLPEARPLLLLLLQTALPR